LLLTGYGLRHGVEKLEIHEAMDAVSPGEAADYIILVLPDALDQVADVTPMYRVPLGYWPEYRRRACVPYRKDPV
jgi:hypothetical protein